MTMDDALVDKAQFLHPEVVVGSCAIIYLVALCTSSSQGIDQVIADVVLQVERCLQLILVLVGLDLSHL